MLQTPKRSGEALTGVCSPICGETFWVMDFGEKKRRIGGNPTAPRGLRPVPVHNTAERVKKKKDGSLAREKGVRGQDVKAGGASQLTARTPLELTVALVPKQIEG